MPFLLGAPCQQQLPNEVAGECVVIVAVSDPYDGDI